MYKTWIKAIGIGLLVMFSASFLEFEIEGGENFQAQSFYTNYKNQLFDLKYNNFELDLNKNPQKTPKTRYLLENYDSNSLTKDILSLLYYPVISEKKVKDKSFFWNNIMHKRIPNKKGEYEDYNDTDFEFLKFSNFKKNAEKEIVLKKEIFSEKKDCKMTNVNMVDGEKGIFYSQKFVPEGTSCDLYSKERQCNDGRLSGDKSFEYIQCEADKKDNCEVSGHKIFHGESEIFYKSSNASANQTCSELSQKRFCVDGKMTGDEDYNKIKCTSALDTECFLLGKNVKKNVFYKEPLVEYGGKCQLQLRSCKDGKLTGRYEYEKCSIKSPKSCDLGLTKIKHDETKTFYKTSKVRFGEVCELQERTCNEGNLSGSDDYQKSFCEEEKPKSCEVGNSLIAHGETKIFYDRNKAKIGEVCKSVTRSCDNGKISGDDTYTNETCIPFERKSCELDGVIIKDGDFVDFYKETSAENCQTKTRSCKDGVLIGNKEYNKASCRKFSSCKFGENIIRHNAARVFYQSHTVPKNSECEAELRACSDGKLSGTFNNLYCSVEEDNYCFFSDIKINNNESKVFYSKKSVPYGETCEAYSKEKFCLDGKMKGETQYVYATCEVEEAPPEPIDLNCYFDGKTIRNKISQLYYKNNMVPYGTDCQAERRVCKDGELSGSFTNTSCKVEEGAKCYVFISELKDKESRFFYSKQKVSEGDSCAEHRQRRTCDNGIISGDDIYLNSSCEDYKAKSCNINGIEIADGEFARFYSTEKVLDENECKSQVRTCDDGELYGNDEYKYSTCKKKSSCKLWDGSVMQNISRIFYKNHTVQYPGQCKQKEIRTCDDGELSGSYTNQYCFSMENEVCFYSGVPIREGNYRVFYSKNTVNKGEKCENFSKKKYCLSGKVKNDQEYIYSSCIENN